MTKNEKDNQIFPSVVGFISYSGIDGYSINFHPQIFTICSKMNEQQILQFHAELVSHIADDAVVKLLDHCLPPEPVAVEPAPKQQVTKGKSK